MKQYCRYCIHANQIEDDMCACEKHNYVMGKAKASRLNKCKDFKFNEIDVFNFEKKYKPRNKVNNDKQLSIFDLMEEKKNE